MTKRNDKDIQDMRLISKITKRAVNQLTGVNHLSTMMDLEAVHTTTPLRLQELLDTDSFNFEHDICGIAYNLNRETKELENCFVPRYIV